MNSLDVRYPRFINGIVALICLGIALAAADALFLGHIGQQAPRGGLWVALILFASTALWCGKTAIAPSLVLGMDHSGITIGRGVIFNKTKTIPWSKLDKVEAGELEWESMNSNRKMNQPPKMLPAVRLVFSRDVSLGSYGFDQAMPEHGHTFVIAAKLMGMSQAEAVRKCENLMRAYKGS